MFTEKNPNGTATSYVSDEDFEGFVLFLDDYFKNGKGKKFDVLQVATMLQMVYSGYINMHGLEHLGSDFVPVVSSENPS